jgi:threonine dehydratase
MVTMQQIIEARQLLAPHLRPSPLIHSNHLSHRLGMEVFLKLESLQDTGSFKVRGALHRLLRLPEAMRAKGVAAASAGNHAQGVAWAARQVGACATIFMPRSAPIAKLLATRSYGARVIQAGDTYDDAARQAETWSEEHGSVLIPAFDDPEIVAGQGTIGLEILEEVSDFDSVIVPVGGGGLIAGIALAIKESRPEVEVLGVQAEYAPAAARSLEAGRRITFPPRPTLADGIAVASPGELTFSMIQRLVDGVLTVEEAAIETAVVTFLERKHLVVEGAGATPLAALLGGSARPRGRRVVLVISGGNLDLQWMDRIVERGALSLGRRMRLRVLLPDLPGSLSKVTGLIAGLGANIFQVHHDRLAPEQPVHLTRVELDLEIEGHDHARRILDAVAEAGIEVMG